MLFKNVCHFIYDLACAFVYKGSLLLIHNNVEDFALIFITWR